jgi:hypothetical protein
MVVMMMMVMVAAGTMHVFMLVVRVLLLVVSIVLSFGIFILRCLGVSHDLIPMDLALPNGSMSRAGLAAAQPALLVSIDLWLFGRGVCSSCRSQAHEFAAGLEAWHS